MKKLLSILGAITLVGAVTPNVISCHNKKAVNNDNTGTVKDLEVLNEIQAKATKKITEKLKTKMYVDSLKNNLGKIFTKVNDTNQTYRLKLTSGDDSQLGAYFINDFKNVFDNVNHDLQNEYSNYFTDKMPLTLDDDRNEINVTFIDVTALKKKFPVDINPEPFAAVRVDYKASIHLEFKNLFLSFELATIYNVTENATALKAISDNTTAFLLKNVKEYFAKLETVNFSENEIFKSLYDKGIWDFSQSSNELNETLKNSFKEYLGSKKEFKDIEITYNAVDLMTKSAEGDLNSKNKGYDGITNNYKQKDLTLSKWIGPKTDGWEDIGAISTNDFVKFYRNNIGTAFMGDNSTDLSLGSFTINWNYINIYGMGLSGNVKSTDGEDLIVTLNLSQAAVDKKLSNWGKIIITFIKYYGGKTINGPKNIFGITDQLYKEISRKNQKNGLRDVTKLLVENFRESDDAKDLEDLDLFNFIVHPQTPQKYQGITINRRLFWDSLGEKPWAVLFTFGEDFNTGLYYSIASTDGKYTGRPADGIVFGVELKTNKK
ncbi:lipoprotein [Spiroplasma sp. SV19]|uniref:lipoprotein n=1 Tax=Spiroplasma sp. SV19 TaxID=2570468 RepID=UPI0024B869ED|nr:lipoprotein [Spiroplasma sp. SV19]WHQ37206.1 hypothetical protein E7Y35_04870 [Spiroplasma sp. SV19]